MGDVRILTTHYDTLRYDEGEGRVVEFNCPSTVEPPQVSLAGAATWAKHTPVWAHGRREEIVARLRGVGAVLFEREGEVTIVRCVEGGFRIEMESVQEERAAAFETTRFVVEATGEVLAELGMFGVRGAVRFVRAGVVALTLVHRYGKGFEVEVDGRKRAFVISPEREEPGLAGMAGELMGRVEGNKGRGFVGWLLGKGM